MSANVALLIPHASCRLLVKPPVPVDRSPRSWQAPDREMNRDPVARLMHALGGVLCVLRFGCRGPVFGTRWALDTDAGLMEYVSRGR